MIVEQKIVTKEMPVTPITSAVLINFVSRVNVLVYSLAPSVNTIRPKYTLAM